MTASLDNSELWILTAKQNELNDVLDWFRSNSEGKGCKISIAENSKARKDKDGNKYYPGTITFTAAAATRTVGFVMACGFRQGPESFAIFASYVFSTFKPKHAMMLGICCGDPKEHKLKDVVFSCRAFNYYEGKIKDKEMKDDDGGETHYPETVTYYTDPNISNLVDEIIGRSRRSEWKSATMVSGPVVQEKAEKVFLRCQVIDRKCTALDMEASAFFNACAMYRKSNEVTPLPVIKAVSDAGDENKNDDCHRQCLYNAADAALSFIIQYFGDKHPDPPLESPAGSALEQGMNFEKITLDGRQETNPPGELKETSRTETNPPGELKETSRTAGAGASGNSTMDTTDCGADVNGQHEERPGLQPSDHISEAFLKEIATNIGKGWKRVARELGLKDVEIEKIEMNNQDAEDRIMKMLVTWSRKWGSKGTKKKLGEALIAAGRNDLAELCL